MWVHCLPKGPGGQCGAPGHAGRLDGVGLQVLLDNRAQLGVGVLVGYFRAGLEIVFDLVAGDARSAAARHPDLAPASIPGAVEPVATGRAL